MSCRGSALFALFGLCLFKGECAKPPRGCHAVYVVPVVALRSGLDLAIIVDGGVSEVGIAVANIDFPPFGCRSRVIYGGQGIYIYNLDFSAYLSTSYIYTDGINLIILAKMIKLTLTKDIKDDIIYHR